MITQYNPKNTEKIYDFDSERFFHSFNAGLVVGSAAISPCAQSGNSPLFAFGSRLRFGKENYIAIRLLKAPETDFEEQETSLQSLADIKHSGQVSNIKLTSTSDGLQLAFAAGTSGNVCLYPLRENEDWQAPDRFQFNAPFPNQSPVPISGLDVSSGLNNVVITTDTGGLAVYAVATAEPILASEHSDAVSFSAVKFRSESLHEVLTAGSSSFSQLKLWDLRIRAQKVLSLSQGNGSGLCSLALHPTRPDIVAAGSEEGDVCLFDLRSTKGAITSWCKHSKAVTGLAYHSLQPQFVFSSAEGDGAFLWDFSQQHQFESQLGSRVASGRPTTERLCPDHCGGAILLYAESLNWVAVISKFGQIKLYSGG